jgi:hypothetical protein
MELLLQDRLRLYMRVPAGFATGGVLEQPMLNIHTRRVSFEALQIWQLQPCVAVPVGNWTWSMEIATPYARKADLENPMHIFACRRCGLDLNEVQPYWAAYKRCSRFSTMRKTRCAPSCLHLKCYFRLCHSVVLPPSKPLHSTREQME